MAARAVFLDRDGVLTRERGFVTAPDQVELLSGAAEGLACLRKAGWVTVVITNQSGLGRGLFSEAVLVEIHATLARLLAAVDPDARWDSLKYCPHHPTEALPPYREICACRKPKPGMLLEAARELGINLASSWMVGDAQRDLLAGKAAGCRTAALPSPLGLGGAPPPGADLEVRNLRTFALTLLSGR